MPQWRLQFSGIGDSTSGDSNLGLLSQFPLVETLIGISTSGIADSPGPKKILQSIKSHY